MYSELLINSEHSHRKDSIFMFLGLQWEIIEAVRQQNEEEE